MNNAIFNFAETVNEPVFEYLPGSRERELLKGTFGHEQQWY
jgi:hypothetical protein